MKNKIKLSLGALTVTSVTTYLSRKEIIEIHGGATAGCKSDPCLGDPGDGGEGDPDELGGGFR